MFETAIITAPRKINYLGTMLDNYLKTWDNPPHVFAEPGIGSYFNQSKVIEHHNEHTLGVVKNWWSAAKWMVENTKSVFVMMCEDDIEFAEDARYKITRLLKCLPGEGIGYISPYCAQLCANGRGWHEPNLRHGGQCGALCMIFARPHLEQILASEEQFMKYSEGKHLDYAIGATVTKHLGMAALTHVPTLVFHIGEHSTCESNNKPVNRIHESRLPAL